jgi:hypothetical protein
MAPALKCKPPLIPLTKHTNILLPLGLSTFSGAGVSEGFSVRNCQLMDPQDGVQSGIVRLRNARVVVVVGETAC